jgi:hypothetical protein
MKGIIIFIVGMWVFVGHISSQTSWQSALLKIADDGSLTYHRDSDGFYLPDFSHAGYRGGGIAIPDVPVMKTISPVAGDNTKHIQDAIDYVGSLALNSSGLRGALLLEAGEYPIDGSLFVKYDGVVLRGVGDGDNPQTSTIIFARGNTPHQRTVMTLGNNSSQVNGTKQISGTISNITEACYRSTFADCRAIDPVGIITGERMYNFNTYVHSQLNLFSGCYANKGRHHYVSNGTSTTSGNVFLRCISDATNSVSEGHRQWTQGMLFDNHQEINLKRDFVLGLYNRVAMGTGHGWSAVHSVLWNCDVTASYGKIGLQKPPTGQNYAIGCMAKTITGNPISASNFTRGFVEGQNQPGLHPQSLYEAQLKARMQLSAVVRYESTPEHFRVITTLSGDQIRISLEGVTNDTLIIIRDISGKEVAILNTNNDIAYIQASHLNPGVYLIECRNREHTASVKFLKK